MEDFRLKTNFQPTVPPIPIKSPVLSHDQNSDQTNTIAKTSELGVNHMLTPEKAGKTNQDLQIRQTTRTTIPPSNNETNKNKLTKTLEFIFQSIKAFIKRKLQTSAIDKEPVVQQTKQKSPLETKLRNLADRAENIDSTAKYLMDVFKLEIQSSQTIEQAAEEFIFQLKEASQQDPPASKFGGKDVEEKNRAALLRLHSYFDGPESADWKAALHDHLSARKNASEGKGHICQPLQEEIAKMQTQNDADQIAFYLMSEVCSTRGGMRKIDFNKLELLLNHPIIKESSLLTNGVLKAAKETQLQAIRKQQLNIVWECSISREDKQKWDKESANLPDIYDYFDLQGIREIAKRANIQSFPESFTTSYEQDLNSLIADMEKIQRLGK